MAGFCTFADQRDVMGLAKLSCFLWGHHVDNHVFKQADGDGAALPVRIRIPRGRSFDHARSSHAVVLSRQARLREARRSRRLPRIRLHAVRASAAVRRRARSVCGVADVQEEGALPLRPVRPSRAPHHDARRVPGYACFCGHSFLKETQVCGQDPPSRDLRRFRPLHPLPDETRRVCRVRLRELWPSVLFCL